MPSGQRNGPTDASAKRQRWHSASPGHPQPAQHVLASNPDNAAENNLENEVDNMVQSIPGGCDAAVGSVSSWSTGCFPIDPCND